MARDYQIKILLDDEKVSRLQKAGLDIHSAEEEGKKILRVTLPEKNQRKFRKAFPQAVLNEQKGEIDNFPEDAATMLFDAVIEYKTVEVMHLFLLKSYKPLAGRVPRQKVH